MSPDKGKERKERERVEARRDADAHTHEPVEAYDTTARPGTVETGKPDRDQLAEGERMDLREKIARTYQPPGVGTDTGRTADFSSEEALERARPSDKEAGRQDRKELTGQRAQSEGRRGETQSDTQGAQQTRRFVGMDTEPQRGGRTVPAEAEEGRRESESPDVARGYGRREEREDRDRREQRESR